MCATFTPVETHGKIVFIVFVVLVVTWQVSTFILALDDFTWVPEPYTAGPVIDRLLLKADLQKKQGIRLPGLSLRVFHQQSQVLEDR